MGSSKSQTTGFRYYLGMHMGLCHGPVDALLEIRGGDREAWKGAATGSGQIYIDAADIWGGDEREGGIRGALDVMMGEPTQAPNDYLASQQGADQPAYRGIFSVVFRGPSAANRAGIELAQSVYGSGGTVAAPNTQGGSGFFALLRSMNPIGQLTGLVAANNPYLKPWSFLVRRITAGWTGAVWNPSKAAITVQGDIAAMNPAHIAYECLTNTEWGMGYPSGQLDLATFTAAADVFHAEGMGLCMEWSQQDAIQSFVQIVMDHAGGVVVQDRVTGLFKLKAIRGGYDINTLPLFGSEAGNIIDVARIERSTHTEAVNEIVVSYKDAATGKDGSVTVQNLATIQAQGAVLSETRQYPGLPTAELALRVAMRDLQAATSALARVTMTVNRTAYAIEPGDVIRFEWLPAGIAQMPLRVASVDYGSLTDGAMTLECIEDVFGLPATAYVNPQPDVSGSLGQPQPSQAVAAIEAPYRELVRVLGDNGAQAVPADAGYVLGVAMRAPGQPTGYRLETRIGSGEWAAVANGDFTPTATIGSEIGPTTTSITMSTAVGAANLAAGDLMLLGAGAAQEIVQVAAVDEVARTLTIRRGCLDTVPRRWPAASRLWDFGELNGSDTREYVDPEVVGLRFRTIAAQGTLDGALAPSVTVTMDQRAARPYPPGNLVINAARFPSIIAGELALSWSHRDRIGQSDLVLDQLSASTGPEAGTTYTIRLYGETGTLLRTVTGITGTTYNWTTEEADSGFTPSRRNINLRFELEAVRGGLTSFTSYNVSLTRAGVADPGTVVPGGSLQIQGDIGNGAQAGVSATAQLTASGVVGSPVWQIGPGSTAGASINQQGLVTLNFASAGTAVVDVILTDHPSLTNTVRRWRINVAGSAAPAASVTGAMFDTYAGAPYFLDALGGEGFTFSRPGPGSYWVGNHTAGLPANITWAGPRAVGCATTTGAFGYTARFNQWLGSVLTVTGTMNVLAAPPCTVWNMADRNIEDSSARFLAGSAPMLTIEGQTIQGFSGTGFVRALNGYTSGRRYWEVRVDSVPAGTLASAVCAGVDRSRFGAVTYAANGSIASNTGYPNRWLDADPTAGLWGYYCGRYGDGFPLQSYAWGKDTPVQKLAAAVEAGSILRFAHDVAAGRLWIGIAGQGWLGGGDPATGVAPTLSGMTAEASPRFAEWKPFALLGGAGSRVTANFGSQAWEGGGPPSGYTTIPFAQVPEFSGQVLDSDRMTFVPLSGYGAFRVHGPAWDSVSHAQRFGSVVTARSTIGGGGEVPLILGSLPRSTGKWQVELFDYSFGDVTYFGLVPDDHDVQGSLAPGFTASTFGIRPVDGGNARVMNGNVQVATTATDGRWTLALDLDASPKTVRVVRSGTVVGTYNLPSTGKPWTFAVGGGGMMVAVIRTSNLQHPQAGFNDWTA